MIFNFIFDIKLLIYNYAGHLAFENLVKQLQNRKSEKAPLGFSYPSIIEFKVRYYEFFDEGPKFMKKD